jgi:lipopolysaccharide exporter
MEIDVLKNTKPFVRTGVRFSQRVVSGAFWAFAIQSVGQVISFVRNVILARMLAPDDFGLMGIAFLAMNVATIFTETGFTAALIQKKEGVKEYLNTAWTTSIIRGFILFSLLFLGAPLVAHFFEAPAALSIVRVISVSLLLQGCSNVGLIFLDKELEFKKKFAYQIGGIAADFVVAIIAVLILRNVWALVLGQIAGATVRFIMSYVIHPYRPRLQMDLAKSRELFKFGKWILLTSVFVLITVQTDITIVGRVLGVAALGLYQMAQRVADLPATAIRDTVSLVVFPAYSKLQDNLPRLREGYLKTLQATTCASVLLGGAIFILAPEFTGIFLGQKWLTAVPAMQVIALAAILRAIYGTSEPIFRAVGKPRISSNWRGVQLLLLAALIYPLTVKWEILGTSLSVFISIIPSAIISTIMVIKITQCRIKNLAKMIVPPLVAGIIMVAVVYLLKIYFGDGIWWFLLLAGIAVLVYCCIIYLSDKFFGYGIVKVIKESLVAVRKKRNN